MVDRNVRERITLIDRITERTSGISFEQISKSKSPSMPVGRGLSVDAVMDLAGAILWPDLTKPSESDGDATRAQAKEPSPASKTRP